MRRGRLREGGGEQQVEGSCIGVAYLHLDHLPGVALPVAAAEAAVASHIRITVAEDEDRSLVDLQRRRHHGQKVRSSAAQGIGSV